MPLAAFAGGFLLEYLLLWAVPLVTFLQPLLRLRAICEHGAVTDFASPLTAARTNLGPRWLLWLFFPFNVNFHVEHHMYPAIPFYNLPAAHRAMKAHGVLDKAEVRDVRETLGLVMADRPAREAAPA
jgi:fatty acid desaturase